jgi:tRNA(Leu) C34 or U34 (ribose-2'-O)-methylase TrmL
MKTKWQMTDDLHLMQALRVFVLGDNKQTRAISLYHDEAHVRRQKQYDDMNYKLRGSD